MGAVHLICLQMMPTTFRCLNSKRFLVERCLKQSSYMISSLPSSTEWHRACPARLYLAGQFSRQMRQISSFSRPVISQDVSTDAVAQKILAGKNCKELLDSLHSLDVETFQPEHTWLFTCHMMQLYHDQKLKEIPWLQKNIQSAFSQMKFQGNIGLETIFQNPNFNIWQKLILKDCYYFNDQQLADCFFAVTYIGLLLDGPVVHELLKLSYVNLPKFHIVPLSLLGLTYKRLPGLAGCDYKAIQTILNRVKEIYTTVDPLQISKDELVAVMSIFIQYSYLIGNDFSRGFFAWLENCSPRPDILDKPESVVTLLHCISSSLLFNPFRDKLLGISKKAACGIVDQFDSYQLGKVCSSLKRFQYYHEDIAALMEKRAMELLNDQCRLAEVIDLSYTLTPSSSLSVVRHFDNAVKVRISGDINIDIVTMSKLCEIFGPKSRKLHIDSDVRINIQRHIVCLSECETMFTSYWRLLSGIFRFLHASPFLTPAHQQKFVENLLRHLIQGRCIELPTYSKLSIYLLTDNFELLNNDFYEDLISKIPNWTFLYLCRLANVPCIRNESTSVSRQQMQKLLSCMYSSLIERLDSVISIRDLNEAVKSLVLFNPQKDPVLADQLINMFTKFTNILTTKNFLKYTLTFGSTVYHLPEVYDKLSSFVVNNANDLNDVDLLLLFCAKVGYKPRMMDKLMEIALKNYQQKWKAGDIYHALKLLNSMSILSYYPEMELAQLFSPQSIEDIEHFIEVSGSRCQWFYGLATENDSVPKKSLAAGAKLGRLTEYELMKLNRSIVLECPQLEVPWFHEQYCQDSIIFRGGTQTSIKFNSEVADALIKILGGTEYFKNKTFSPYYYLIDFECILDKKNLQPLSVDVIPQHQHESTLWRDKLDSKYQKIAICLMHEKNYCFNSKLLRGDVLIKKRHLEIMDYKFVEVPYFDWYSMALADWNSKVEYLHKKIMA